MLESGKNSVGKEYQNQDGVVLFAVNSSGKTSLIRSYV
jgi:hypothetical protein